MRAKAEEAAVKCPKCWAEAPVAWVATCPIDGMWLWDDGPPELDKQPLWVRKDHYVSVVRACPTHGEFGALQAVERKHQLRLVETGEIYFFDAELWVVDERGRRVPFLRREPE